MRGAPITLARVRRRRNDQPAEGVAPPRPCILRAEDELGRVWRVESRSAVALEDSPSVSRVVRCWPSLPLVRRTGCGARPTADFVAVEISAADGRFRGSA